MRQVNRLIGNKQSFNDLMAEIQYNFPAARAMRFSPRPEPRITVDPIGRGSSGKTIAIQ